MVSRYFQCSFLKYSVFVGSFCSKFDIFLFVFCMKVVQNGNAKGYAEISAKMTHKSIDGPLSHQRIVGGIVDWKFKLMVETWGIMTNCGDTEGSTVYKLIDRLSLQIIDEIIDCSSTPC